MIKVIVTFFLSLSVIVTALSIVYVKHVNRKIFSDTQVLQQEYEGLVSEWGKLQLELSTWGSASRVENFAREKLPMRMPNPSEILVIKP